MYRSLVVLSFAASGVLLPHDAAVAQSVARVATMPLSAVQRNVPSEAAALQTRITLKLDDVPIGRAIEAIARQASINVTMANSVNQVPKRVTLRVQDITVLDAFHTAIRNTPIRMTTSRSGRIRFDVASEPVRGAQGTITGKVTDASTKRGVAGATIQLPGSSLITQTNEDGAYRLADVPVGKHTLVARRIGYAKVSRLVSVDENMTTTVDIALDISANTLDQVVVTGTIVQTELKAVPSAITVVTAKQIEERGITKIDQLFRGDIPGLFAQNQGSSPSANLDEVTMYSRGATALSSVSAGASDGTYGVYFLTNSIKTYVDGVELTDSRYLSQIDPKSIDRVEILTGPQASTIYGSNAINGVMQIFTKRGIAARPQLTLNLLSGWVENNFSDARVPQHDHSAQLNGSEGKFSYNAGGSWIYVGRWIPAKQMSRASGFAGGRLDLASPLGRVTTDMTLRYAITRNRQRGSQFQPWMTAAETGKYRKFNDFGRADPFNQLLVGKTWGITLNHSAASWLSQELGIGSDVANVEFRYVDRAYVTTSDTTLGLSQSNAGRRSLRYAATARMQAGSLAQATITAGADAWQYLSSTLSTSSQALTGALTGTSRVTRQPSHNTGAFLQTQLGFREQIFLTYGLRAEWNPAFGREAQPNYAPRYGLTYTREVGPIMTKLRGSYGRSTRPPQLKLKSAVAALDYFGASSSVLSAYGNFNFYLANPDLAPEYQRGGEGGIELYFGTRGSLIVTRYNQTVDGLVAVPAVDSVRSFAPCPVSSCSAYSRDADGYGYYQQFQYVNVGSIRNQGWELQSTVQAGPLTARGTYSWTKSRVIGVTPRYRAAFANQVQYQPGATFQYLPEHTWALGVSYAQQTSSVSLSVMGVERFTNRQDDFFFENINGSIRLMSDRLNVSSSDRYMSFNPGYAQADLTASHRFAPRIEGILQVQNLTNHYWNDYTADYATIGRQTKVGVRLR